MTKSSNSLYIHIPFCEHICSYCDFCKVLYNPSFVQRYLCALQEEINDYGITDYQTIYIGGGTPSALSSDELEDLLCFIHPFLATDGELTIECNIENTTLEKLKIMKKYGVTRLSFGVQSFQKDILETANRHHDEKMTRKIIKQAQALGFDNINIDLIFGFQKETLMMLKNDVQTFLSLDVPHISIYSLTIHDHTVLGNASYPEQNEDDNRMMYDTIYEMLINHGYHRYEVSNFARNGYESRHNQVYWRNDEYIGVGIGAHSYYQNVRYANTRSISAYLNGKRRLEEEKVSLDDQMLYEIMLRLRTDEGIDLLVFKKRYGLEKEEHLKKTMQRFIDHKWMEFHDHHLRCTYEGMMVLDYILRDIFYQLTNI